MMAVPQQNGGRNGEPSISTDKSRLPSPPSGPAGASISAGTVEPIGRHLRRIASAAAVSVAPVVAGFLLFGYWKFALSIIGGAFVSFAVFSSLRILVYKALGALSPASGSPESPGVFGQALFALGTFVKFIAAAAIVYGLWRLHVNLLALLVGFVIAQIAIAVVVSRSLKGPV